MKPDAAHLVAERPYVPSLPASARTKSGVTFDPSADVWSYKDGVTQVSINFAQSRALGKDLRQALKAVLLWYAENKSPSHLVNMYQRFLHFVRFQARNRVNSIETVTSVELLNYKASLTSNVSWYLGSLRGFLIKWHGLSIAGVTDDAVVLLKSLRIKGNTKGVAVMTMDPYMGPYTPIEQEAIQSALNDAYSNGTVDEAEFHLTWLFMALGQRTVQYAALKVCDISATSPTDEEAIYTLNVPRAKQRTKATRMEFKVRPLISQIGRPLFLYAQQVRGQFAGLLNDPAQAPMFPQKAGKTWAPGYKYHHTWKSLGAFLTKALKKLEVPSERTGNLLHISPIRFRRTFASRAAEEGHGELVIAEMLDHTDTQNVGVYVAAVPKMAERIDRAMAMSLAPLAQAFKGVLIKDESEATRRGDPSSRIVDLRIDKSARPMGSCGQHSFCNFAAPIACYTCTSFQPWLDGPHEAVLTFLLKKREKLLSTTDVRMASVNDRTILAVAQVVQACQAVSVSDRTIMAAPLVLQ